MERRDCMLQMDELYFSSFDFEQSREDSNTEYDVSFHIEYAKNKKDSAKFRVMIRTAVENKTGSVRIRLDTVGIFTIENFELDRDLNERILKANTVAIMFPYIRSQISLPAETVRPDSQNDEDGDQQQDGQDGAEDEIRLHFSSRKLDFGFGMMYLCLCNHSINSIRMQ